MAGSEDAFDRRSHIGPEYRHINIHMEERKEDSVIFDRMVGAAHDTVSIAAAVTDQGYGEVVEADIVPDLFQRTGVNEGGDAVGPGLEALAGKARGHRNHVLFRHPGVDKAGTGGFLKGFQGHKTQVARQKHKIRVRSPLNHGLAKFIPHASPSSSKAVLNCSSFSGR